MGKNDQLQGAEDVGNEHSDELLDHIEEVSGNDVPPYANDKVFDELLQPAFNMTAANVSIDDKSVVDYRLNYHTGVPSIRVLGYPEHEALHMLNKSTGNAFTGLKSFLTEFNSIPTNEIVDFYSLKDNIQYMNKAEELNPAEFVMVKASYQVFDKMPQLTFVWPFENIVGATSYIPLIDCVPKVFDPGDGIDTIAPVGWRFNEMKDSFGPKAREVVPRNYKLDDGFGRNIVLSFIIDSCTLISIKHIGVSVMLYMPWPSFCIYNELIQPSVIETTSSKSSTGKYCSISTVEKVGMFSHNPGVLLMDTSRELFLSKEGPKSCEYLAVCLPNDWGYEASVITSLELDVYFCVDAMLMIIFDPA